MKTISFTLLLAGALLAATPAWAQSHTVAIPAQATVVSNAQAPSGNNNAYWVCARGRLTVRGNNNLLFGEPGSGLTLDGNNGQVYSRSTQPLSVRGNNNVVYAGAGGRVTVDGNNNVVYAPTGAEVLLTGNNNSRQPLGSLAFTYGSAPAAGCRPTATAEELAATADLQLLPNPVGSDGQLALRTAVPARSARLYDATGRTLRTWQQPTEALDLQGIPRGLYVVEVALPTGTVARRVVVD